MAAPDSPFPLQQASISFGEDVFYRLLDDLLDDGVVGTSDMAVQQFAGGARMSVQVNPGEAYVAFTSPVYGGKRRIRQSTLTDSGTVGNVNSGENWTATFVAADGANPRIDRVVATVKDSLLDSSGLYRLEFKVIQGVATAGATLANLTGAAAVPVNSLLLANVLVRAATSSILTSDIDTTAGTVRPIAGVGGGRVPGGSRILSEIQLSVGQNSIDFQLPAGFRSYEVVVRAKGTIAATLATIYASFPGATESFYSQRTWWTGTNLGIQEALASTTGAYAGVIPGAQAAANTWGQAVIRLDDLRYSPPSGVPSGKRSIMSDFSTQVGPNSGSGAVRGIASGWQDNNNATPPSVFRLWTDGTLFATGSHFVLRGIF